MATSTIKKKAEPIIKRIWFGATYNLAANGTTNLMKSDFDLQPPAGYTCIGTTAYTTGCGDAYIVQFWPPYVSNANAIMSVKNVSSNAYTNLNAQIVVTYIKSEFVDLTGYQYG